MPVIMESVGLEYEFAVSQMDQIRRKLPTDWSVDRDGSVTRESFTIGGLPVEYPNDSRLPVNSRMIGGEAISPILSFENSDVIVSDLDTLMRLFEGEPLSDLASVHVHIACGKYPSAEILKNLIRLAIGLEAPMFRLSVGEQRVHRGTTHEDYLYCRPITGHGPQFVLDESGCWYHAFDLDKILRFAQNSEEVIKGWCRSDCQPTKWIPARYYWIHMASVWNKGTVELRLFNQTGNVKYIKAWVDLTRAFLKRAWSEEVTLPEFGLGCKNPLGWEKSYFSFADFMDIIHPQNFYWKNTIKILEELWFKTDWQRGCEPQANHLCTKKGKSVPLSDLPTRIRPIQITSEERNSFNSEFNTRSRDDVDRNDDPDEEEEFTSSTHYPEDEQ